MADEEPVADEAPEAGEAPVAAPAAEGERGGDDDSSSSDGVEEGLHEEDLAVLEEAGLDTSQLRAKRAAEEAAGSEEKRRRVEADDEEVDLFGDFDAEDPAAPAGDRDLGLGGGGLGAAVRAAAPDAWDGLTDGESIDDFIVEDEGAAKRRRRSDEAAQLDIDDDQLREIMDIFGSTDVLKPLDEIAAGAEESQLPPPQLPMHGDSAAQVEETQPQVHAEAPDEEADADPDLVDKLYESKRDYRLEADDLPERFVQAYQCHPELLDKEGRRRWTEEEHTSEAKWIFNEAFANSPNGTYEKEETVLAVVRILELLHLQKFDPVYIVVHKFWEFKQRLYKEDLHAIFELDIQWQNIWVTYRRLTDVLAVASEDQVPEHVSSRAKAADLFEFEGAEVGLKDLYDWTSVMLPDEVVASGNVPTVTADAEKIAEVRKCRYDEKLGIKSSLEGMTLQDFGITPERLGENIEYNQQIHKPSWQEGTDKGIKALLEAHQGGAFQSPEAVQDALVTFLARLIATEPRVRRFVRAKFWDMCAVSTRVTEAGRPVAHEAAMSFKSSYRAFHLVNRPVDSFRKENQEEDELFLDCLDLQRKGFLEIDFSLIARDSKNPKLGDENKSSTSYKLVLPGHDEQVLHKSRQRLSEHMMKSKRGLYVPANQHEQKLLKFGQYVKPKLEAAARSHEVETRKAASWRNDVKEQAETLFKCARMEFEFDHLNPFMTQDPIYEALINLYCSLERTNEGDDIVKPGAWNALRKKIIYRALKDELYPMLWAEVQMTLVRDAEKQVCKQCRDSLTKIVDAGPFRLTDEMERERKDRLRTLKEGAAPDAGIDSDSDDDDPDWLREKEVRKAGQCSVLVVVPDLSSGPQLMLRKRTSETAVVGFINPYGEPVDIRVLFQDFYMPANERAATWDPKDYRSERERTRLEHRQVFMNMLKKYKPAVILLPVVDRNTITMRVRIQEIIGLKELAGSFNLEPQILFSDSKVPRIVAYHQRLSGEGAYRDYAEPQKRLAISSARFFQDPLAETCQLWHEAPEENALFKMRLHRLQHAVSQERLGRALLHSIVDTLAKAGLHINRVRRSPHLAPLATFLPGLGPRKARLFRLCLADSILTRDEFAKRFAKQLRLPYKDPKRSPVISNALPFIKIQPDLRDNWSLEKVPGFDRTRLSQDFWPWLSSLCREALRNAEEQQIGGLHTGIEGEHKDELTQVMRIETANNTMMKVLMECDLMEWAQLAGQEEPPEDADQEHLFEQLISEIKDPFKDERQEFQELDDETTFHLIIGQAHDEFKIGSTVTAVVRMDTEYPEEGREAAADPKVICDILPTMIRAQFRKKQSGFAGGAGEYLEGCNIQFKQGQPVVGRVVNYHVTKDRNPSVSISVENDAALWYEKFPLSELDRSYFIPLEIENWTKVKLGHIDAVETQRKEKKKDWVRRPRNIRHTNWYNMSHDEALAAIEQVPLGNVIFRPSKRYDVIVAMLKVLPTDGDDYVDKSRCFRTFDVYEKDNKSETKGFEIARDMEVDGRKYEGLDEIIARHMDPIMENFRLLQDHSHFGLRDGEVTDKVSVRAGLKTFCREQPRMLHYCFLHHDQIIGHGMLLWALGNNCNPREEIIEITPDGYALWGTPFDHLQGLVEWFKKVGWRNASKQRKDFMEAWKAKSEEARQRRGEDVVGERPSVEFAGWAQAAASGLATPMVGTPTFYGPESGARTPWGFGAGGATPNPGAMASRTPVMGNVPATPAFSGAAAPMTPANLAGRTFAPTTPGGFGGVRGFAAPSTPARVPSTPSAGLRVPSTPSGGLRMVPSTPAGLQASTGSHAPTTPAGLGGRSFVPSTPAGVSGAGMPMTPGGMSAPGSVRFAAPGSVGGTSMPGTPGLYAPTTPGAYRR